MEQTPQLLRLINILIQQFSMKKKLCSRRRCPIQQDIMFWCAFLLLNIKRLMEHSTMQRNDTQCYCKFLCLFVFHSLILVFIFWPYGWSLPITYLIQVIKYWQYSEKQVKGQPYHARILHRLKQESPPL